MELVPALFSGAAAGGTAAASTGLTATSVLAGSASVLGSLATLGSRFQQAKSMKVQALETDIESMASDTAATQKNTSMKTELMRVLGENSVTAAAAGIDLGSGIAADAAQSAKERAASEISIDRSTQDARRAMYRAKSAGLRSMARQTRKLAFAEYFINNAMQAAKMGGG